MKYKIKSFLVNALLRLLRFIASVLLIPAGLFAACAAGPIYLITVIEKKTGFSWNEYYKRWT